jgi:site-specific DNA-methyltransferase (adenine-specific)
MFTGMALIDAGFEVRDSLVHLFGSGMPKGQNLSKAIDKAAGATREVVGPSRRHGGGNSASTYAQDDWTQQNIGTMGMQETAPATDEAKQWEGWNTTLKPAHEVWWLVRKPLLEKTVVKQVLATGTGAINVDACRVEMQDRPAYEKKRRSFGNEGRVMHGYKGDLGVRYGAEECIAASIKGRWPANAVLSHAAECLEGQCSEGCAVAALDEQSGVLTSGALREYVRAPTASVYQAGFQKLGRLSAAGCDRPSDSGGASRFFYTAKVPPAERKLSDGTTNQHPTAKSIKLMRYFVRLVTPPNGTVLDPFAGSGTTGVAALKEGFGFLGIELDPEHHRVAQLRLAEAMPKPSILESLSPEKREQLITDAIQSMIQPNPRMGQHESEMQRMFGSAVLSVASNLIHRELSESAEFKAEVQKLLQAVADRFFADEMREKLADKLTNALWIALNPSSRY